MRQQGIYINGERIHANATDSEQRIALRILAAAKATAKVAVYSRGKLTDEYDMVDGEVVTVEAPAFAPIATDETPIAQKD